MIIRYQLLLLFSVLTLLGYAQTPNMVPKGNQQILVLPDQIADKRKGKESTSEVKFLEYPYQGERIDLRDFKKNHPLLVAPDFVTIKAPDLAGFGQLNVLIGLIEDVKPDFNAVVIWITATDQSQEVSFFLDHNLDRNFKKDLEIIKLNHRDAPYKVTIKPKRGDIPTQVLYIKIPKPKPEPKNKRSVSNLKKQKAKLVNKLAIGAQAGVGIGNLYYEFDNLAKGYPTWYDVNYSQKGAGLHISYNTYRFRLELAGTFQNHFYYTSYRNIRFGEPVFPEPGSSIAVIDNVQVDRNLDEHDRNYFEYSATLGIRFHLSPGMDLQPYFGVGQLAALSGEYVGDRRIGEAGIHELPASTFYQGGIRFNFTTGYYQSLFIDLAYQNLLWRPKGFFEEFEFENLDIDNQIFKFSIGYRFGW